MPDKIMGNFEPTYGYRKNVFIINDIDLIVPPTNIDIQTEDLVWQWRALRSRATTKVPSGQGQIAISVTIPFTGSMVLDMHRLIVEFRHSPFCYIENRFLRETIVPHWPIQQAMAFTMTGLNVAPMQGSSDTWIMQLDLTWFNYFPYVHNWLYRKDWHSVPVRAEGPHDEGRPVEVTIGWDYVDGVKKQKRTKLPQVTEFADGIRTWDSVRNQYQDRQQLTVEQMEQTHHGEIFDLLPLPDRMAPAEYVQRPAQSRIYTRYINLLQRDALRKNFDIDLEAEIHTEVLKDAFFNAVLYNNDRYTFGLHSGPPIGADELYTHWKVLRDGIIREMNKRHGGVLFHFFAYKDIRLPRKWGEMISNAHKHSLDLAKSRLPLTNGDAGPGWILEMDPTESRAVSRIRVRQRFSSALGADGQERSSIIGYDGESVPMPVDELRVTSYPKWRSGSTRSSHYGRDSMRGAVHWGTDFGAGKRDQGNPDARIPIFAIESGTISAIRLTNSSVGASWKLAQLGTSKTLQYKKFDSEDFKNSILAVLPQATFRSDGTNVSVQFGEQFPVGTFVKSLKYNNSWYFVEANSAGNRITMSHANNSLSHYYHLSEVSDEALDAMANRTQISAGTLIGYMGNSGPMTEAYKIAQMKNAQAQYDVSDPHTNKLITRTLENFWDDGANEKSSIWHLSTHLHFEYWETEEAGASIDEAWTGDESLPESWRWASRRVPVDMRGPVATAVPGSRTFSVDPIFTTPTQTTVKEYIGEEVEDSDEYTKEELTDVINILDDLWRDGWLYYDRESGVQNVWWKHHKLHIGPGNQEQLADGFYGDPTVLTAVAGGLRHVVANIPILGYEFPTQQHLGSIEPFYSFEFCSVDHEGTTSQRLAGVSKETEVLLAMRAMLHANARNFRGIVDSWCCAVDTFTTRLLGTFSPDDVQIATYEEAKNEDEEPIIADIDIKRRMMNTRSNSMTVQGHPGMSCHTMEFSETNPYESQSLNATAPAGGDIELAYKQVLNAVYKLKFEEGTRDLLQQVLVAQLAGANTYFPEEEDYGVFSIDYVQRPSQVSGDQVALYRDTGGNEWLLFGDDFSGLAVAPESISSLVGASGQFDQPFLQGVNAVPLSDVFSEGQFTSGGEGGDTTVTYRAAVTESSIANSADSIRSISPKEFDISSLLLASQQNLILGEVPMEKILDYWLMIHKTLQTAQHVLAESDDQVSYGTIQPGGNTEAAVSAELYDLPVRPNLFKSYQLYLATMAATNPKPSPSWAPQLNPSNIDVINHITQNPNWLEWHKPLEGEELSQVKSVFGTGMAARMITEAAFGTIGRWTWSVPVQTHLKAADKAYRSVFGVWDDNEEGVYADLYAEATDDVMDDIAAEYMYALPIRDLLEERFKAYVTSTMFGDLLGSVVGEGGNPVFGSTTDLLKKTTASSGNFQCSPIFDVHQYVLHSYDEYGETTSSNVRARQEDDFLIGDQSQLPAEATAEAKVPVLLPDNTTWKWWAFNQTEGIYPPNSPFVWWVDAGLEQKKLKYFKRLLARYARELLNDFDVLKAFGLQGLSRAFARARITGSPALPDMDLPHHPYYGDVAACPPDFYMWNMYEDGQAHSEPIVTAIQEVMGDIVSNCYNSMKRIETGGKYSASGDRYVQEPTVLSGVEIPKDEQVSTHQRFNAEGTDTGSRGHTAFPFYPNPESTEAISNYMDRVNLAITDTEKRAKAARENSGGDLIGGAAIETKSRDIPPAPNVTTEQAKAFNSVRIEDIRLSNFEGAYGQGGGIQYPRRVTSEQYTELQNAVQSARQMFGSRSGYLNQREIPESLEERLRGTLIERDTDPSHRFNKESLNQLALNSAADIFGQKRRMARAYPTFKLFFVEEDEFESRLLNFDDFFSYNGVTSFTVEQSRKSPADHAVISLLNVAGTLDGTKRDAVTDLDYFSDSSKLSIPGEASSLGDDPTTQGSALDQPFGALVLRPGLNVQLRVGYSNDPDLLEVLLNGRVVDVTWNQGGDRAEILVQSFGTELVQAIKGTSTQDDNREFATTHHLLGAMMLEPELQHFGRWEFGQLYQIGEGQDSRLDFVDYSREGFLGRFRATSAVTRWLLDHPIITATAAIGGGALLTRIPGVARLLRPATKILTPAAKAAGGRSSLSWVSRWLGTLGTGGPGAAYYRKALVDVVGNRAAGAVTVASKAGRTDVLAVLRSNQARLALRNIALRDAGGTVAKEFMRKSAAIQREAIRKAAAGNIDDAARALAKADAEIANLVLKGQWMSHPLQQIAGQSVGLIRSIGFKPLSRIWNGLWYRTPLLVGGASIAALSLSGLDWAFSELYEASIDRIKAYFRQKQVSLLLSPQDDNLFPPHPKDYMEIYENWQSNLWNDIKLWTIKTGVNAFIQDDEMGHQAARWFGNANPLDKRAPPVACSFRLVSTTIWDIFHEMSLRHPGWIYAVRPYGNSFRYTMFFGVPSQRYWAQPADNEFVSRANDLYNFLGSGSIDINEYRRLYGDIVDDGVSSQTLESFDADIEDEAYAITNPHLVSDSASSDRFGESDPNDPLADAPGETDVAAAEDYARSIRLFTYTARALKEYLKALDLRFKPFRRYHSITSEEDLVWNGLMGSENATYNAVDVTYFKEDADYGDSPASSALFKAHAFIPEHQLRVLPLQPSYNCRGYQMAMRYGVGSLLHTMREMYRGEIIVLGNPRIRPWDVGILSDSYNDMVGPFEVEQVVHQFSHETGFVTEIKPSALVIANETSSWPVLEAMKVAALAIKDVDDQFQGLGATDPGARFRFFDWMLGFGAGGDSSSVEGLGFPGAASEYREYLEERAAELRPFDPFTDPKSGESDLEEIRALGAELGLDNSADAGAYRTSDGIGSTALAAGGAAVGIAVAGAALKGIPWVFRAGSKTVPRFTRLQGGLAMGGVGLLGASGVLFAHDRLTPSLAWLLGSPILFLQALRGDSIMVVPLMKNGYPIVSGLNLTDPNMIWNNFKGDLGRWVEDTLDGTRDLTDIWRLYGKSAWRRNEYLEKSVSGKSVWDWNKQVYAELTGEQ